MKNILKLICFALALIMLFALVGCDKNNDFTDTSGDVSSNDSSDISSTVSDDSSSAEPSSDSPSSAPVVSTIDPNHPYYNLIKSDTHQEYSMCLRRKTAPQHFLLRCIT